MKPYLTHTLVISFILLIGACTNKSPRDQDAQAIRLREDSLKNSQNMHDERKTAFLLVRNYMDFAKKYPEDSLSGKYLFSAGRLAMNIREPNKAIESLDLLLATYPDHAKYPDALFLKAYILENSFSDTAGARVFYTRYLKEFPDKEFADDAKASIQNLGKSPEQLVREFEMKENQAKPLQATR